MGQKNSKFKIQNSKLKNFGAWGMGRQGRQGRIYFQYTPTPLHPYTPTPLHPYTPTPLHPYTPTPLLPNSYCL
ncbi:MAG: hypothetical protein ACRAVC_01985 [Trichormus sp.]